MATGIRGGSPSKPLKPGLGGGGGHQGVHRSKPFEPARGGGDGNQGYPPFGNPSSRGSEVEEESCGEVRKLHAETRPVC